MIPRILSASPGLTEQVSNEPLKLPGLVSALRPIKRGSSQLSEEANLLRRFTYKNKNQHKGCGWWRKIVEVDRVIERVGTELQGLLGEFGIDKDKDEIGTIDQQAVVKGLLRLPRSMLIVEKSIEVMLSSASILEQLIHSRAFLSFALVVVALVARLHTLATVLLEDLSKTSLVLVRLIHSNSLLSKIEPSYKQLPRTLKRFITLHPASLDLSSAFPPSSTDSSLAHSAAPTPLARSPALAEEYGAVVARSEMLQVKPRNASPAPTPPPRPTSQSPVGYQDVEMADVVPSDPSAVLLAQPKVREKKRRPSPPAEERLPSLMPLDDLAPSTRPSKVKDGKDVKEKKRRVKEGGVAGAEGEVKRKKKKRVKSKAEEEEDEIDSIFG